MIGVLFVLMFVVISRGQMEMKGMGGFSDMMDSFKGMSAQFEKMKNMKPWYQGPNACFDESYKDVPFGNGNSGPEGSAPFEMCQEMELKRICSARVVIKGQAKERIRTYQCCHGSVGKLVDGWMQCVK
ncbi:hypothetical protein JTE90_024900 [Oedothorax gibbosus]|uniref:Uncharacterized protein n=1 Tax=Oedothorax gibbosus TaxID=931172 RepID=A0AAV6U5M2_9ARAC|nr:hypothetical protein JTE90_024900 [Oedothorax gibbosus]